MLRGRRLKRAPFLFALPLAGAGPAEARSRSSKQATSNTQQDVLYNHPFIR